MAALSQSSEPLLETSSLPTPHDHDVTATLSTCFSYQPLLKLLHLLGHLDSGFQSLVDLSLSSLQATKQS